MTSPPKSADELGNRILSTGHSFIGINERRELAADVRQALSARDTRIAELEKEVAAWREAMPRCAGYGEEHCTESATKEQYGGMCDDFNLRYWCDRHAEKAAIETQDTDWAALVRASK